MNNSVIRSLFVATFLFATVLVSGCSDSNSTGPNNTGGSSVGVGSSFVLYDTQTDGAGNLLLSDTIINTITSVNQTYNGKSNVTGFTGVQQSTGQSASSYYSFENGDFSQYSPLAQINGSFAYGWYTIPLSSTTTKTIVALDSTVVIIPGSYSQRIRRTLTYTPAGHENISIGTESFDCTKYSVADTTLMATMISSDTLTDYLYNSMTGWYSAKLQMPIKTSETIRVASSGKTNKVNATLVRYTLK